MLKTAKGYDTGRGIIFMYTRKASQKRRNKIRIRIWVFISLFAVSVGTAGIFLVLTQRVLAAPENPELEELSEKIQEAEKQKSFREQETEQETAEEKIEIIPGVPLIIIDPGHGGIDDGSVREAVMEKDINLEIGRQVESRLKESGYQVIIMREGDTYLSRQQRVEKANSYQADLYVSIHQNVCDDPEVKGIETWYEDKDGSGNSERLAKLVQQETVRATGAAERQVRDDGDYYVVKNTAMTACLIETGFLSNQEEREQLSSKEYQDKIADGIAAGIDLYFNPKTMYLTFDDGPSAEYTDAVLDILKKKNVKATFFLIGEYIEKNPKTAKRIAAEGHAIGIHCNVHDYHTLYQSVEGYVEDFETARRILYEVTGVETNIFRFPGGSVNAYNKNIRQDIIDEMTERGYVYFDWNASLGDAAGKPAEPAQLIQNALDTTLQRKRVVLLAHDRVENTVLCLEELLDQFPEYQMKLLEEETEPIQF